MDLRKECELSDVGDIKGPARLSGGLKQPIGCRQREHVVVKENGKARRGIHTNENSGLKVKSMCMCSRSKQKETYPELII